MAGNELIIHSQHEGGITNYYFPGITAAGSSDLSVSRGRIVYETIACEQCKKAGLPCWRPAPGRGRRFKKCLLCEKLQLKQCNELDIGKQSLILPPTPYEGSFSFGLRKQSASAYVSSIPPPPWAQSSLPKRSASPISISVPPLKRQRTTDREEDEPIEKLDLIPDDSDDNVIRDVTPVGCADMDPIKNRSLYETKQCESCVEAEKRHCWRAIDASGQFTKCTRCYRKNVEGCQDIPVTLENLIIPGSKFKKKPILPHDSAASQSQVSAKESETPSQGQTQPIHEPTSSSSPPPPTTPEAAIATSTPSAEPAAPNSEALSALISAAQSLSTDTLLAGLRPIMQAKSEEATKRYHAQLEALNTQLKQKEEAEAAAQQALLNAIAEKKRVESELAAKREEFETEMKQYRLFLASV